MEFDAMQKQEHLVQRSHDYLNSKNSETPHKSQLITEK